MRSIVGVLLAVATLLCSGAPAKAKTQIRVVVSYYSAATESIFQSIAKDFGATHPDAEIKIEVVPWHNLQQRLTTDIAGGTAPDISIIGTRWLADFVANDIPEPLDSYITPEFRSRFFESFMAPSTIGNKTYALPFAASVRAMYYNKTLLGRAGIANPPQTWDQLTEISKNIKALGPNVYGFALQGKEIETDAYWYYALWTHGGELIENGKSGIASPAAVAALTLYRNLIDQNLTQPEPTGFNSADIERLFKQGRVGMLITGPWLRGQIKIEAPDLQYDIAPIPAGSRNATYGVTDSLIILRSSKNKRLAWEFISETIFSVSRRVEFTTKEGFLPVTKFEAAAPVIANDSQLKAFANLIPHAHFAPAIPNWEQAADTTIRALQQVYTKQATPEAALKRAASSIDTILKQ